MPRYNYAGHEYSFFELRRVFPAVSFPPSPSADDFAALGVTVVPDPDQRTHRRRSVWQG